MKKLIPFILLLLSLSHIAFAQLKLYVYENNGETTEFIASNVDSIAFTAPGTYPVDPNSDYKWFDIDSGTIIKYCNNEGVGTLFTSKINGKSIFLPASGYMASSDSSVGELGYYWTATLDVKDPSKAMLFRFNYKEHQLNSTARFFGQPIRPVIP